MAFSSAPSCSSGAAPATGSAPAAAAPTFGVGPSLTATPGAQAFTGLAGALSVGALSHTLSRSLSLDSDGSDVDLGLFDTRVGEGLPDPAAAASDSVPLVPMPSFLAVTVNAPAGLSLKPIVVESGLPTGARMRLAYDPFSAVRAGMSRPPAPTIVGGNALRDPLETDACGGSMTSETATSGDADVPGSHVNVEGDDWDDGAEDEDPSDEEYTEPAPAPPVRRGRRGGKRAKAGANPFVCPWPSCSRSFRSKSDVDAHHRTHTGDKPLLCRRGCGRGFAHSSNRRQHERAVHEKVKRYHCRQAGCHKVFAHPTSRNDHEAVIHRGKRPYKCHACGSTFTARANLSRHRKDKCTATR